ncbi:MAG: dihydrodipicolinate reductase C-terminal domain-containing protein [Gallionella sp.]
MRVGIIGFGKTGRAVAAVLLASKKTHLQWVIRQSKLLEHRSVPELLGVASDELGLIYSKDEYSAAELLDRYPVDIIVDFSSETGLDYYGAEAAKRNITIISAVSSYPDEKIKQLQHLSQQTCVLHSANITLGINFLIIAAKVLKNIAPHTDIEVIEEHFRSKPEISGTAKVIVRELNLPEENIKSIRAGGIIGTHEILFGFPFQTIRLKHESIAREAFGNGVLFAIENLYGKSKGFYKMEDLLLPFFKLQDFPAEKLTQKKSWWQFWVR